LGDSRAYLLRQRALQRLTTDHSLAQLLVQVGDLTPDQAAAHPTRNQLTQYVGMPGEAEPGTRVLGLTPGDRLLLCTDGLTTMIKDKDIEAILRDYPHPDAACRELITTAKKEGGTDNITVIVLGLGLQGQ
ncbi:MAG TPA: SpoIIE family protein phosphatase, partial [Pseudonocardiaceae bacterium]|nr:SpoIIE family protein phosphatase [Pseudonocardiaceae bacterium]